MRIILKISHWLSIQKRICDKISDMKIQKCIGNFLNKIPQLFAEGFFIFSEKNLLFRRFFVDEVFGKFRKRYIGSLLVF